MPLFKKKLNLFQALRKEKTAKARNAGNTEVPNLQDPLVEIYDHGGSKRKAEVPANQGRGKDVKKVSYVSFEMVEKPRRGVELAS